MVDQLEVSDLVKSYGDNYALQGVSCVFRRGEVTAIVGANGAGKTTLIDAITGFVKVDSGEVRFGVKPLTGLAPYAIARAGVVRSFQEVRLMRSRTCLDNVRMAHPSQAGEHLWRLLLRRGVQNSEDVVTASSLQRLRQVGLEDLAQRIAGTLSYGQQKLLSTACCLATDAAVVVFDEPFAGLAPRMRDLMGEILAELRRVGSSVIFVDHNMDVVRRSSDRLLVMRAGKLVASGSPADLLGTGAVRRAILG